MNKEATYWITLAHDLPAWSSSNREGWRNEDINNLITKFFYEKKISIVDFFRLPELEWKLVYQLTDKQANDLIQLKNKISDNVSLTEMLCSKGMEVIPVTSPDYSQTLKNSLKRTTPPVLYIKGNKQLISKKSVAFAGSRDTSELTLQFTSNIAALACKENKALVSGSARGADKQALDTVIESQGKSIVVLPHGIGIFYSGFRTYQKQIEDGNIVVLSTFPPKAGWSTGLAAARSPVIYGLATEIYIAEFFDTGGTLEEFKDALKAGKTVFVRKPDGLEKNANHILIREGAVAISIEGNLTKEGECEEIEYTEEAIAADIESDNVNENGCEEAEYQEDEAGEEALIKEEFQKDCPSFEDEIKIILSNRPLTTKEILTKLNLDWSEKRLTTELKKLDFIKKEKNRNGTYYELRGVTFFD